MQAARLSYPLFGALLSVLAACAAPEVQEEAAPPVSAEPATEKPDDDHKLEDLKQDLEVSRARHEIANLENEAFLIQQAARASHAQADVQEAKANLADYLANTMPSRLAQEKLNLQGSKDNAMEAAEELEQIRIMYEEQDLEDMTREFVISRGRRRAERSEKRIAIQEAQFRSVEEHELPQQVRQLERKLVQAEEALAKTLTEGEVGRRNKALGLRESETKLKRKEREIAELTEKNGESE